MNINPGREAIGIRSRIMDLFNIIDPNKVIIDNGNISISLDIPNQFRDKSVNMVFTIDLGSIFDDAELFEYIKSIFNFREICHNKQSYQINGRFNQADMGSGKPE
jgi:hypothetical protein